MAFWTGAAPSSAQITDKLPDTVALLHSTLVETTLVNGVWCEVWLKPTNSTNPTPKTFSMVGSGFFVVGTRVPFLVTASHVAAQTTPNTILFVKGSNGTPQSVSLSDISFLNKGLGWQNHPNADVSILPLAQESSFFQQHLAGRFLPLDVFPRETIAPQRDLPVRIMGFPLGLGIGARISPMTRVSGVSSDLMTVPRFDNGRMTDMFLLEDPSIGGYSGAPAYDTGEPFGHGGALVMRNLGAFSCVGIVHGTISDNTGGKLAAITPAAKLVELVKQFEAALPQGQQ